MVGSLLSALLLTVAATSTPTTAAEISDVRTHDLTAGVFVGSSIEAELSWFATNSLQLAIRGGVVEKSEGSWRAATDVYYHFPNVIGSVSQAASMGFFVGLGAQIAGPRPEESVYRFGERVSFGLRYTLDAGKYELITMVAPGLLHRPRLRATLDALIGFRFGF